MLVKIRKADIKDIPAVCELINLMTPSVGDYTDAQKKYASVIESNPGYRLLVAEVADKVVGTAMVHLQYKLSYHCGTAAHLEDVVVDPNYRKLGIGESLVQSAINFAKENNCYKIMLTCYDRTVPYYENLGFESWDVGMRKSLKKEDLYVVDGRSVKD